jgi:D-proline reductase (dithiol) PrdB
MGYNSIMFNRMKNRLIARAVSRWPALAARVAGAWQPTAPRDAHVVPWTPVRKPLSDCTVAIVTTAGVHHREHEPFNMADQMGDPTFRVIDARRPNETLAITHDYYDHTDAERDINIVYPIDRLRELAAEGHVGRVSDVNVGLMGHIDGPHVDTLVTATAPAVAALLREAGADVVLLVPG